MKKIIFALLFACGCYGAAPADPDPVVPDDDAGCPTPDLDTRYCATIDKLRGQLYDTAGIPTLACETDDDCIGACVCGGCGVP